MALPLLTAHPLLGRPADRYAAPSAAPALMPSAIQCRAYRIMRIKHRGCQCPFKPCVSVLCQSVLAETGAMTPDLVLVEDPKGDDANEPDDPGHDGDPVQVPLNHRGGTE